MKNLTLPSIRLTYLLTFVATVLLMLIALYMQYAMGLEPCALCVTQRACMIAIGLVALVACIHHPRGWGRWPYVGLGLIFTILGGATAGRQLWLQNLPPDRVPACGPSIEYILDAFPFWEALAILFRGDGNCAEVAWRFLGLSIPGWTLIAFIGFGAVFLWQGLRGRL